MKFVNFFFKARIQTSSFAAFEDVDTYLHANILLIIIEKKEDIYIVQDFLCKISLDIRI